MHFRTKAIHIGNHCDQETGAVIPPIHPASTFVQLKAGEWRAFDYSRSGNPTRSCVQETIAALENGCGALVFASGMAATHTVTMLLAAGDHVVCGTDTYGGTYRLLHNIAARAGVSTTLATTTDLSAVEAAFTDKTKLLWIESPGNPLLSISDIAACAGLAHRHGALLAIDSTFATPALTRPLDLGADIVMHSATKYLGGHSDLMGGALVTRTPEIFDRLYYIQNATGNALNPWECFLLARGIKTLGIRMQHQCAGALEIAQFLTEHPRVRSVLYPGLPDHPGHELARRQMNRMFGAMLSVELAGDFAAAKRFVESTKLFQLAVSLGAVESLIEQPASMSHASYDRADRIASGITDSLVRLSVGLEDVRDLKEDLSQALD
jgi:cystathionine gamma-lyase